MGECGSSWEDPAENRLDRLSLASPNVVVTVYVLYRFLDNLEQVCHATSISTCLPLLLYCRWTFVAGGHTSRRECSQSGR